MELRIYLIEIFQGKIISIEVNFDVNQEVWVTAALSIPIETMKRDKLII